MRGFPKALNTREDYLYIKDNFPKEDWAPAFQALLDTVKDWMFVRMLDEGEAVPAGDDYKTVEPQENSVETRTALYQLQTIPGCKLFELGFTEEEVRAFLAEE